MAAGADTVHNNDSESGSISAFVSIHVFASTSTRTENIEHVRMAIDPLSSIVYCLLRVDELDYMRRVRPLHDIKREEVLVEAHRGSMAMRDATRGC